MRRRSAYRRSVRHGLAARRGGQHFQVLARRVQHLDPPRDRRENSTAAQIGQRQRIEHRAGVGGRGLDQAQLGKIGALAHELGVERDEVAGARRSRACSSSAEVVTGGVAAWACVYNSPQLCTFTFSASAAPSWAASRRSRAPPATRHRLRPERLSADVRPAAALGIELIEGYDAAAAAAAARRGRGRQRHEARQPADRSAARERHSLHVRAASGWRGTCCRPLDARRRRHARQDHDVEHARVDARARRASIRDS